MRFRSFALTFAAVLPASLAAAPAQDVTIIEDPAALDAEIIVEGERRLDQEEINKGLDQLTRRTSMFQSVPRFFNPICVSVLGLDKARSHKIAERIRDNAAAVGLVANRDKCTPNAIAIITDNPQAMYSGIYRKRHHLIGFPELREYALPQLEGQIKAGKAAVSWSTFEDTTWYANRQSPAIQNFQGGDAFWGWNTASPLFRQQRPRGTAVVMFDWNQLDGVHIQQLADFATIHLLGSPRMSANTADTSVPTILSLFEQSPDHAPQRLTTFDRAYLCAIYHLRFSVPATRMNQNIKDVYDTDCVRVGAPAQVAIAEPAP